MLLRKDNFYQGKVDGLYGHRSCGHTTEYRMGYLYGRRERSRARREQQRLWNMKGVASI